MYRERDYTHIYTHILYIYIYIHTYIKTKFEIVYYKLVGPYDCMCMKLIRPVDESEAPC